MSEALRKIANQRKKEQLKKDVKSSDGCKLFGVHFDATAIFYYAKDRADLISLLFEENAEEGWKFIKKDGKVYMNWSENYQEEVNIEEIPVVRGHVFSVSH